MMRGGAAKGSVAARPSCKWTALLACGQGATPRIIAAPGPSGWMDGEGGREGGPAAAAGSGLLRHLAAPPAPRLDPPPPVGNPCEKPIAACGHPFESGRRLCLQADIRHAPASMAGAGFVHRILNGIGRISHVARRQHALVRIHAWHPSERFSHGPCVGHAMRPDVAPDLVCRHDCHVITSACMLAVFPVRICPRGSDAGCGAADGRRREIAPVHQGAPSGHLNLPGGGRHSTRAVHAAACLVGKAAGDLGHDLPLHGRRLHLTVQIKRLPV